MYKVIGVGLLSLFALMVIPANATDELTPIFYGSATMVLADSDGNQLLTQTVHNQITDQGEEFIIDQVFATDVAAVSGTNRIGAICISGAADAAYSELTDDTLASTYATTGTGSDGNHCKPSTMTAVGGNLAGSTATVSTASTTFTSGTDLVAAEVVRGILICTANGTADFKDCSTTAGNVALAAIDLADVTMSGTDTVTIQYTFDITTAST